MSAPTESRAGEQLGRRAITSVIWTAIQRWAIRITGFVTVLILTRHLSPADFGTVAIATSLLPFAYLLADMGFSTYVVQATELGQRSLSTAFWFTAGAGVVLSGLLVASGQLIAALYGVPGVAPVVYGLVPTVLFVTLSTVPMSLLRRRMEFRRLAVQSIAAAFAGQAVAVVLALMGFGVWALIAQTAMNQLVASVLAWYSARWRPSFSFAVAEFKSMASFGTKVVGVEAVATVRALVENAVITAALGVSSLGYLSVAQRLTQITQDVTAAAILPVSTVVFAQVRETRARLQSAYVRSLGLSYAVIVPAMVFLAVSSPVLLPFLFGKQWDPSVAPSQVLAIVGILVLGAMLDHGLFYGSGKPGRWFVYGAAIDGLTVVAAIVSAPHGLVAWSIGFLIVAVLATVVRWPMVGRLIGARWTVVALVFVRAMLAGILPAVCGVLIAQLVSPLVPIASLILTGLVVVIAQLAGMSIFMRTELREGARLVKTQFGRGRRVVVSAEPAPVVVGEKDENDVFP